MAQTRLVVLGDSFVEGHGDPHENGGLRGWCSRFAELFGIADGHCRNLGQFGSTTQDVVDRQLGPALVNKAPFIGLVAGVNDLISDYEPTRYQRNIDLILRTLVGSDTTVFTATYPLIPRIIGMPPAFREVVSARFAEANDLLRAATRRHGVLCLDISGSAEWRDPALWSDDGLHPGPEGHRRFAESMAELVCGATGMTVDTGLWMG